MYVGKRSKEFTFSKKFTSDQKYNTLVTLGLGSPSRSLPSLEQLAVQTALCGKLGISNCVCFDPIFSADDLEALSKLDCVVDSSFENYTTDMCLFFMPHCDKEIYVDVLRRRLSCLEKTVIIGNSFILYEQQSVGKEHVFWRKLNACTNISRFVVEPEPEHNSLSDTKIMTFKCFDEIAELVNKYFD